jgi:hypothetical protein
MLKRALVLLLCVPAPAGLLAHLAPPTIAASAQEQQLGDLAAVQAEILAKARELAEYADSIKADVERDELYQCILGYDSDDKDARKALGYTKKKDEWVFKKYNEPKNRASEADLSELQRRRTEAVTALEEKIDACFPTDNPSVRHKHGLRVELEKLVLLDGDNEFLRQRAWFAWDEQKGEWRMREVVAAKLDRAERAGLLKELEANVPAAARTEVDPGGQATKLPFGVSVQIPRVHVMSTGTADEAQTIASIMHRAPDFLSGAFGLPDPWRDAQWRVYDMADPGLRSQFYGAHPEVNGDRAQLAEAGGVGFGNNCMGVAAEVPATRFDAVATQRVGAYLGNVFGADLDKGWVRAGLGLYLSYQLCGTRLSLWIQRDEYGQGEGPKLGERLQDPTVDWLDEARVLLRRRENAVNLVAVLGKPAKQLTAEDLLTSYAVSAYLYEGRRRDLIQILQRIGKGETPIVVFESQLEMPIDAFRERLIDWLGEMRKG